MMNDAIPLIDTVRGLRNVVEHLREHDWFALDTEFVREETYWPQLCLVQVATDEALACIDPFALDGLEPLYRVLDDASVTKVVHAGGQDLEIFHHLTGRVPGPVFDTQLAAPLLGYPQQAGFGRLVSAALGVALAKGHARLDWRRRPLSADALAYAADDVRYLVPLYRLIRDRLTEKGRLRWLDADLARLCDPARYDRPTADAWRRLKGVDRLTARARAVVQALAEWREHSARERDVPRGRIAGDDVLVDIARAQPRSRRELGRLRCVRGGLVERHGDRIVGLVAEAAERTPPPMPPRRHVGLDGTGEALVDALSAAVRLRAAAVELDPATLASRRELARIAAGAPVDEVLAGWRAEVVGDDLGGLVEGRYVLANGSRGPAVIAR